VSSAKRRVALLRTGGTIASIGRGRLDLWEYMDAMLALTRTDEVREAPRIVDEY
jgi:hypothetical protein